MINGQLGIFSMIVNLLLVVSCLALGCAAPILLAMVVGLFRNAVAMALNFAGRRSRFSVSDSRFLRQMYIRLR